jgi:hypothetical protein
MGATCDGKSPDFDLGGGMTHLEEIWEQVLQRLQLDMPKASYETWAKDTQAHSLEKMS